MSATREDVEKLKHDWNGDPCYDLYPTPEGFEEFAVELQNHQLSMWARWERQASDNRKADQMKMGLFFDGHNLSVDKLYNYLKGLEKQIVELKEEVNRQGDVITQLSGSVQYVRNRQEFG